MAEFIYIIEGVPSFSAMSLLVTFAVAESQEFAGVIDHLMVSNSPGVMRYALNPKQLCKTHSMMTKMTNGDEHDDDDCKPQR